MGNEVQIGQIYRDTYGDKDRKDGSKNKRTIRVIGIEPDGRYLCRLRSESDGREPDPPRHSRISAKTLATGYVLLTEANAK